MTTERFTLIREIGEGGLGKVWLARDNDLARDVAIKEIKPGTESSQAARRLIREAQITGQLQHPNIVPVYEVKRGGRPFYAMKLVKGETLSEAIQRYHAQHRAGQSDLLSLPRLLNAFVSICEALAYAHSRGVIHRDLKPQNIVLGEYGEVIVLDWGLAKVIGEPDDAAAPIALSPDAQADRTRDGATLGTPAYMAPEQAAGRLDLIDARTDIYGLGAILFEILTDQPPFFGGEITELLNRIIVGETPRARQVAALRRETSSRRPNQTASVPSALDAVCAKAMAKRRSDRYSKATELARDVQLWLTESSEEAARMRRLLYVAHMNLVQTAWENNHVARVRELLAAHLPSEDQDDLRSFEWYYWNRLCNSELLTLRGHNHDVMGVAFSPDGRLIASSSGDETVKVWDVVTGQELFTLEEHSWHVRSVAFSRDGRRLVSASADQTVKVWDADTGHRLLTLNCGIPVSSAVFSPDGKRLASADGYGIKVWDATTGQRLLKLDALNISPSYGFERVEFSPDGEHLASASSDATVQVWDAATGQELLTLRGHTGCVMSVTFSPDGKRLASASGDQTVKVWDAKVGQELLTLKGHTGPVSYAIFSPDGKRLASASADRTVKVWDVVTGQISHTLKGHTDAVRSVMFSPDGNRIVSASADETVKVWAAATDQESLALKGHTDTVESVAFSPDGQRVASASEDTSIKVWDVGTGHELLTLNGHTEGVWSVAFSPDGRRLASATGGYRLNAAGGLLIDSNGPSEYGEIKVWDATTGQELLTLKGHARFVTNVAFSPNGKLLASASKDQTVKVWDLATGKELLTLKGHTDSIKSVAFSPDGKQLASASADETVKVWNALTGQQSRTLKGHLGCVSSVTFSPDGKRLASASWQTVKVWGSATGEELLTLKGHSDLVLCVAFSPEGTRLASASHDKTVRVWDTTAGQEVLMLKAHSDSIPSVAFSPDGTQLASASSDGTIRVWGTTRH